MSKSFIESIIPFITNMRKGIASDEPQPTGSLIKMKGGDTFKNFHFNTSLTPKKDDFTDWHSSEGMSQSVLFGFDWYYEDTKEHQPSETDEGIGAFFIAKGTPLGEGEYIVQQDSFGLVFMDGGIPIYCDEGMSEVMKAMFGVETFPVGWISDSLKGAAEYFNWEEFLQEDAYGILWNQGTEYVDYDQDWNGKFIGFYEEDYYEPGPTPPPTTHTVTTNSVDNTTISGAGTYEEDTDVVVSIQANEGYQFVGTPTATENGETLELTNVEGVYSATITVHQDVLVEFTAEVEEIGPAPTTTTFSDGQTIYQGDKVYVDTTKASELQSWLETNVNADNPQVPLVYAQQSTGGQAFALMGMYADGGYGVMAVAGTNMVMLYDDQDGFNESGLVDSCFVIPEEAGQDYYYTVSTISPDDSWNGTIFSYLAKE